MPQYGAMARWLCCLCLCPGPLHWHTAPAGRTLDQSELSIAMSWPIQAQYCTVNQWEVLQAGLLQTFHSFFKKSSICYYAKLARLCYCRKVQVWCLTSPGEGWNILQWGLSWLRSGSEHNLQLGYLKHVGLRWMPGHGSSHSEGEIGSVEPLLWPRLCRPVTGAREGWGWSYTPSTDTECRERKLMYGHVTLNAVIVLN